MRKEPSMKRTKNPRGKAGEEEAIYLPKSLYDKFKEHPNCRDMVALYVFYYATGIYQDTNQPYAADTFCMQGLRMGNNTFYKTKKDLIECKAIEPIVSGATRTKFGKPYIKLPYYKKRNRSLSVKRAVEERTFVTDLNPDGITPKRDGMAPTLQKQALSFNPVSFSKETNAYKEKKNALNMTTPGGSSCKDEEIGSTNSKINDPKFTERKTCPFSYKWGDYPKHKECHNNECNKADECEQDSYLT